ncbi:MAG: hypothetical protein KatS3mg010_0433 [Acidimicrobiia bacterium]|nr:MAG: hypothetical protein KatS3mg010_0433 [Acidimicrobiia bacterium]
MLAKAPQGRAASRGRRGRLLTAAVLLVLALPMLTFGSGTTAAGGSITTPPFALVDAGSLTLRTGAVNDVVRRDAADAVVSTQAINVGGNCVISTTPTLLSIATGRGSPGYNTGTIGDRTSGSGGQGTGCGLVEAGGSLTLGLGTDVADLEISSFALDVETRKNLVLVLDAYLDGRATSRYELRTGTSIVAGEGSTEPGSEIFNCNAAVSSNPNAGDRDNCRFAGSVLADRLVLTATIGEFGLSGGASGGATQPSVLELTDIDGLLDCQSRPNSGDFDLAEGGDGTPAVGLVRKDNLDPDEPCELVPVDLRTASGPTGATVEFLADKLGQVSAAYTLEIEWTPEEAQEPIQYTTIEFADGNPVDVKLCLGTPVFDPVTGAFEGIAELLDDDPTNDGVVPDDEPTLEGRQHACYFERHVELVGAGEITISEGIYLVGDALFTRR